MSKTMKDFENKSYNEVISNIKKDKNYVFNKINESPIANDDSKKYIAIKDIHASIEMPVTVSSNVLKDYIAGYDSHVVSSLKDSGYNIVGTLNMDEFAMGGSNTYSAFGITPNAINNENIAGGSSGGSAYAVASGMVPLATGTDTGGSIRQPAALNGIYGFKPSYGLVSRYGTLAFASSFDTIGMLASDLNDLKSGMQALIKPDSRDQSSFIPTDFDINKEEFSKLSEMKVCVIKEFEELSLAPHVKKSYNEFKNKLTNLGISLEEKSISTIPFSLDLYVMLAYGEASSNLSRYDGIIYGNHEQNNGKTFFNSRNLFGEEVKKRLIIGTLMLEGDNAKYLFANAKRARSKMQDQFNNIFSEYDIIISPSLTKSEFSLESDTSSKEFYLSDLLSIPANLCGIPSMSFPLKKPNEKNPVGLQILSKKYDDAKIFEFAKLIKEELND